MEATNDPVQMICQDGNFYHAEVEQYARSFFDSSSFRVVSIIGGQNTGKSFLLNRIYGTNFTELTDDTSWGATTQGIWISGCRNPNMMIMDVEGFDGQRAEQGPAFEIRTALFALRISDVMLFNLRFSDLDRFYGGNVPLLETIFHQRVKLSACPKTKLVIVLRDVIHMERMGALSTKISAEIMKVWYSVNSQPPHNRPHDYIEVSVAALPFPDNPSFEQKCLDLKQQISAGHIAGYTASEFSSSAKIIWQSILQNSSLDMPSYNEMISSHHCKRIVEEKLKHLGSNEKFKSVISMDDSSSPSLFCSKLQEFLDYFKAEFNSEASIYDPRQRAISEAELKTEILRRDELGIKCESILQACCRQILEDNKQSINRDLCSGVCIKDLANRHVKEFGDLSRGLKNIFPASLITINEKQLEADLTLYATEEFLRIQKKGLVKKIVITSAVAVTIGAALGWCWPAISAAGIAAAAGGIATAASGIAVKITAVAPSSIKATLCVVLPVLITLVNDSRTTTLDLPAIIGSLLKIFLELLMEKTTETSPA